VQRYAKPIGGISSSNSSESSCLRGDLVSAWSAGFGIRKPQVARSIRVAGSTNPPADNLRANNDAVITAFNPRGHHQSDVDNSRLAGQLEVQVRERGLHVVRVDGVSHDRAHRESGVALKFSREDATTLASSTLNRNDVLALITT